MSILLKVKRGVPQTLDPQDNPTFERWLRRVENLLVAACGVVVDDLDDMPWREWYDHRLRPIRAANKALKRMNTELW